MDCIGKPCTRIQGKWTIERKIDVQTLTPTHKVTIKTPASRGHPSRTMTIDAECDWSDYVALAQEQMKAIYSDFDVVDPKSPCCPDCECQAFIDIDPPWTQPLSWDVTQEYDDPDKCQVKFTWTISLSIRILQGLCVPKITTPEIKKSLKGN